MSPGLTLALDTSTVVAVGLARGGEVLGRRSLADTRAHVEQLVPLAGELLGSVGATLSQLTRLVVGTGPGPFTGLRVGIATAQTLGLALGIEVRGVASLDVLARQAVAERAMTGHFLVVTDARRREVYWSEHDSTGARVRGPEVGPAESLPALPVLGPGAGLDPLLSARREPGAEVLDAATMAALADELPTTGLEPLYLRRPDATPPGRPKSTLVPPPASLRRRPREPGADR